MSLSIDYASFLVISHKLELTAWTKKGGGDDDPGETFSSYIKDADPDDPTQIFVDLPEPRQAPVVDDLVSGMVIGFSIKHETNGQLIAYARIGPITQTGMRGMWLKVLDDYEATVFQRRAHVRVPVSCPVSVVLAPSTEAAGLAEKKLKSVDCRLDNLSAGGARFASPIKLDKNRTLHLVFTLEGERLSLECLVVRSQEMLGRFATLQEQFLISVFFNNLTPAQERQLVQVCFKQELKRKSSMNK